MATRTRAFGAYAVELRNPQWSLSGRSANGDLVAVSLWADEFRGSAGSMVYDRRDTRDWANGPGKVGFFRDLAFAVAQCGGLVHVVVSVRDRNRPGHIVDCYARPNLIMRVVHLDPVAGAFRLEQVVFKTANTRGNTDTQARVGYPLLAVS